VVVSFWRGTRGLERSKCSTMIGFAMRAGLQALKATASNRNAQLMAARSFAAAAGGKSGVRFFRDVWFVLLIAGQPGLVAYRQMSRLCF